MPKTAGGRQGVAGQPAAGRARLAPLPAVTDPASGRGARIGKISLARPPAPRTPLWRQAGDGPAEGGAAPAPFRQLTPNAAGRG